MAAPTAPPLTERVRRAFDDGNAGWLPAVFAEGGGLVRADGDGSGRECAWRYRFENVRFAFPVATRGPKCGDNGGVRANGMPCGRKARKDGDGRCAGHPYAAVELTVAGDADGDRRPLPASIPWSDVRVVADGDMPIEPAAGPPVEALAPFVSATAVWNDVMLLVKAELPELNPEAWFELPSGERAPADPIWRTEKVLAEHPWARKLNDRKVIPGYFLSDYGVEPGGTFRLKPGKQ